MHPKQPFKLIAGFAVALGLLIIVTWFAAEHILRVEQSAASVAHSHQVLGELKDVLSLMQDVETGARGFAITGNASFLEPFDDGAGRADRAVRSVCELTAGNSRQRMNCDALAPLITKRIAAAKSVVELRRTVGFDAARDAVAGGEGKAAMDQIRVVIGRMVEEEQTLLRQRSAAAQREAKSTTRLMIGGVALAFMLLVATFAMVLRENQLRQRTQVQLDRFFTLSLDMLCIAGLDGHFKRLSPAFTETLGHTSDTLMAKPFLDFVHPDDRASTMAEVEKLGHGVPTIQFENRYECQDGSWRWLSWKAQPVADESLIYATARDITKRKQAEQRIAQLNTDLQARARELATLNKELESFSYSVSHDLRAPLRSIDGFSQILLEDCAEQLNDEGKDALQRVRKAAIAMGELIDALLELSRVSRVQLRTERVDLSGLAATVAGELRQSQPDRRVDVVIASGMVVEADPRLLKALLTNLLGNAWKYTQPRETARIEFGTLDQDGESIYFVRDNGVGFDMRYVDKLFGAFQRLHSQAEFAGTGIGLATVHRIIHRHGGRAWAEGVINEGATFYFTLRSSTRRTVAA